MGSRKAPADAVKELTRANALAGGKSQADPTLEGSEKENEKVFTYLKWLVFGSAVFFLFMLVGVLVVTLAGNAARARSDSIKSEDSSTISNLIRMINESTIATNSIKSFITPEGIKELIYEKLNKKSEYVNFLREYLALNQTTTQALEIMASLKASGIDRALSSEGATLVGVKDNMKNPAKAYYPDFQSSFHGIGCHIAECKFYPGKNQFTAPDTIEACMKICAAKRIIPAGTIEYGFTYNYRDGSSCFCKDQGGAAYYSDTAEQTKYVYYRFS